MSKDKKLYSLDDTTWAKHVPHVACGETRKIEERGSRIGKAVMKAWMETTEEERRAFFEVCEGGLKTDINIKTIQKVIERIEQVIENAVYVN